MLLVLLPPTTAATGLELYMRSMAARVAASLGMLLPPMMVLLGVGRPATGLDEEPTNGAEYGPNSSCAALAGVPKL
jgi:hypothetical protein